MKKSLFLVVFLSLLISLGTTIYFYYQNYTLGDREDREELLIAVMIDLFEVESISKGDIEEIKVFRTDAGIYPFYYNISVSLKNGEELSYEWANKEKSSLRTSRYNGMLDNKE